MARRTLLQRLKQLITGGRSKTTESSSNRRVVNSKDTRRVSSSNTSDRRAYINTVTNRDDLKREDAKETWEKTKNAFKASTSKATPDPKEKLRQKAAVKAAEERKQERKDYNKATDNRYNVSEKGISDKEKLKRRQAVKSRAFDAKTAVKEEEHELKYHPVTYSAARGAARGASLTGELLEKKGTKGEAKKAQEYYEKNKNKVAHGVGEAAGTMAAFALTANPSKVAVSKALPRTTKFVAKGGEKVAERLAKKEIVRKAAKKEVANAIEKGLIRDASEDVIKRVAKQKAKETVANLGEDLAQNITTSVLNDFSRATANNKLGSEEWWKDFGTSTAANFVLGGAATVGLPAAGKGIKRAFGGVTEGAEKAIKGADVKVSLNRPKSRDVRLINEEPTVKVDLNRRRKTDVKLPNEEPSVKVDLNRKRKTDVSLLRSEQVEHIRKEREIAEATRKSGIFDVRLTDTSGRTHHIKVEADSPSNARRLAVEKAFDNDIDVQDAELAVRVSDTSPKNVKAKAETLTPKAKATKVEPPRTSVESIAEGVEEAAETMPKPEYETLNDIARERADEVMGAEYKAETPRTEIPEKTRKLADKRADAIRAELAKEDVPPTEMTGTPEDNIRAALAEDKAKARAKAEKISKGQAAIRDAFEEQTGEKWNVGDGGFESDADKHATFDQLWESRQKVSESKGRHVERKASAYAKSQVQVANRDKADFIIEQLKNTNNYEYDVVRTKELYKEVAKELEDDFEGVVRILADVAEGKGANTNDIPKIVATSQFLSELLNDVPRTPEIEALLKTAYMAGQKVITPSAQGMNLRRGFVQLSPASKMDTILTELAEQLNKAQGFTKKHTKGLANLDYHERIDYIKAQLMKDTKLKDAVEKMVYTKTPEELDNLKRRNEGLLSQIEGLEKQKAELAEKLKAAEQRVKETGKAIPPRSVDEMAQIKELDAEIEGLNTQKQILDSQIKKTEEAGVDPDGLTKAQAKVIREFNKHNAKTGYDVVQQLRYIAMLLNPKTHMRNLGGMFFFQPIRNISNAFRAGIEDGVVDFANKLYGTNMTLDVKHGGFSPKAFLDSFRESTEAGKKAAEALKKKEVSDALFNGSKLEGTQMYRGRGKFLLGKGLDAVSDFNSFVLGWEDNLFKGQAFRENYIKSYERLVKEGVPITKEVEAKIEAEAVQESMIATFNEYNTVATYLNKMNKTAYNANAPTAIRWAARAGNAAMPFAKVPANLTKQAINYSPMGIAKGMANIRSAAKSGNSAALNKAIDELASGLTGTGIFALGALLGGTTDWFTTNVGKNDLGAKFKKDRGYQNYSINFVDPETGKGHSFTLDWLQPVSAAFFMGVETANQYKEHGLSIFDAVHAAGDWAQVTSRLSEPVMDSSMMSGLNSMIEGIRGNYDGDDNLGVIHILLRETVQSYLNSLVPSVLGQASRTLYQSDKQILGDNDWQYWKNATRSKAGLANLEIEGLGGALGADTDVYGKVKNDKGKPFLEALKEGDTEVLGNYGKAALKNFISPMNIQQIDMSQVDQEKLEEYRRKVKEGADPSKLGYLFPKKAGKYQRNFSYGSEEAGNNTDVEMTNKELSIYNQAKMTGGGEAMRAALDTVIFNRWDKDADGNSYAVDGQCYSQEEKDALIKEFEGKPIREVEKWLWNNPLFQSASEAEQKQVLDDLWSLDDATTTVGSKRVGERAVVESRGGDVVDYDYKNEVPERVQKNLTEAIDAGIITEEQALDMARNGAKKYYRTDYNGKKAGTVTAYYNKKEMLEYLEKEGYSYEEAEALYNAFKRSDAKEFSGFNSSSGRRGYRRRGYRRYGRGGSSEVVKTSVPIKQSDFKANKATYKDAASALKTRSTSKKKTKVAKTPTIKVEPPKVKFKKYEV